MPVTALGKRGLGRCDPPHLSDLTQSAKGSGAGPGPLRTRADNEVRRPHVQASLETRMASRAPPTCRRDLMSLVGIRRQTWLRRIGPEDESRGLLPVEVRRADFMEQWTTNHLVLPAPRKRVESLLDSGLPVE
ncbi:hypothetical protein JTE90_008352 [Oedothorax gibbosus]|uniref:Uncharacterized protein n=1 Tax=Oedothorax gibbosus TaxID=931172 RepID=A0AAV6TD64_9ARAC|nr:hypothetical protein JTE90_008352 [Oedothorax gibbosus]